MSNAVATPEREVAYIDKSGWGDGPWQSEPDKVQWTDGASGLPCLAVRNPHSGHWCGYVGVAEGHPEKVWWFGFDCAHSGDLSPAMLASASDHYRRAMERAILRYAYRTLGYVQEQCRGLAEKLAALA